jgi:iron complex outermembrane receptor protein
MLCIAGEGSAQSLEELRKLSIEDLGEVEITSVSRRPERLSEAPAAIFVISRDDIRRSGATSLPEALRLAPNLEVARVNSQGYAISSRGLNSVNASNKLLVLIDGRSIYTPFFSSVFWDQQQILLDDVDRIEVISGPGGTLYGANAVNGVINVVTRSSRETQGGLVDLRYGNFDKSAGARWGGSLGELGAYRAYALGFRRGNTETPDTISARDNWYGRQAGFRTDLSADGSFFTLQGDIYENRLDTPTGRLYGGNVLGRWTKPLGADSSLEVQAYYDKQVRLPAGQTFRTDTYDVQAQHVFPLGGAHRIVWGGGYRRFDDRFVNTADIFTLRPEEDSIDLTNLFAQDTISLSETVKLTLGLKLEYNTLSGFEYMPNVRVGWSVTPRDFLWASVSRVVRTPSRLDRRLQAPPLFVPADDFRSERLIAWEAGYRAQPIPEASFSLSLFYNQYDGLRTTSPRRGGGLPLSFENGLDVDIWGFDFWAAYSPVAWWRTTLGLEILTKRTDLERGIVDVAGIQTAAGHDPGHQVFLRNYFSLGPDVDFFVGVRHIGALDTAPVKPYWEADARLAWRVIEGIELSVAGQNLVHAHHPETVVGASTFEIPRNVYAGVRFEF